MPDREKVIKEAERIMCSTVSRDMIDSFCEDVIALLKEQEAKLKFLDALYNYINPNDMEQYTQMYGSLPVPSDGR